jgi:hypothetical protein
MLTDKRSLHKMAERLYTSELGRILGSDPELVGHPAISASRAARLVDRGGL